MEKLVNLVNDYNSDTWNIAREEALLTSEKFWFVKWLLVNQKVDEFKLHNALKECAYINDELAWTNIKLTMLLSIQEKPLEFLISLLK